MRIRAPYQLFPFCGFAGLAVFGPGSEIAKRFVSAVIAFGPWRLSWARRGLEKFAKSFGVETKNAQLFFGIHVSEHFCLGVGFPAVRSAFWGPSEARRMPLRTSSRRRRSPFCCRSPCGAVRLRAQKSTLAAVWRGLRPTSGHAWHSRCGTARCDGGIPPVAAVSRGFARIFRNMWPL